MDEILQFLDHTKVFFFATADDAHPHVRPFGFAVELNDRLYFGTGDQKPSYKQLKNNPRFELCAYDGEKGLWMRLSGIIEFDTSYETLEYIFSHSHFLREKYGNPSGPQFVPFFVKSGQAVFENREGDTWSVYI